MVKTNKISSLKCRKFVVSFFWCILFVLRVRNEKPKNKLNEMEERKREKDKVEC